MLKHISTYFKGIEWLKEILAVVSEEKFEQTVEEADEAIAEEVN